MSTSEQALILDPPGELRFKGPFTDVVTVDLKLANPTDKHVCFKVKTTAPKHYRVRPYTGILQPNKYISVEVMLRPFDFDSTDTTNHRFMVQSMFAPENLGHNLDNLWKDVSAENLMDTKLECVFEIPDRARHRINPEMTRSHESVSNSRFDDSFRKTDSPKNYPSTAQMACTNQGKAQFISHKLSFLTDQGDRLISAVRLYVHRITAAGESWTQGGGNNLEYQELSQTIEAAIDFIFDKCAEITGGSLGVAANQLSCEQPAQTSQSIAAAASTPATSDRQSAAPLASTASTSYRQSTESVQPADAAHMKPVLDRIAVMEEAMFSFRSTTEKVAEQQSGIDQQMKELLSTLSQSDKKHRSWYKKVKRQISDINETQDAIDKEQKTRLQSLEKQLKKISTAQNRQKGEIEKLVHVPNVLTSVSDNADALDDRIDDFIDESRNIYKNLKSEMRDLEVKVKANTHSVQVISENQAQKTTLLRQLETRLQSFEADYERNVKNVQKQAEKGTANLRILCQMLNDRLRPLEKLRTCLNKRTRLRDDNVKRLSQVIQEVAAMSPRLKQLEMKSPGTRCGFMAWTSLTGQVAGYTINQYKRTNCNIGENFNADRGIFTAPVDGLYVTAISVGVSVNEHLSVDVKYKQNLNQWFGTSVCRSSAVVKDTPACGMGVVYMKAGEVLYLRVYHIEKNDYNKWVNFSCFLLGCVP